MIVTRRFDAPPVMYRMQLVARLCSAGAHSAVPRRRREHAQVRMLCARQPRLPQCGGALLGLSGDLAEAKAAPICASIAVPPASHCTEFRCPRIATAAGHSLTSLTSLRQMSARFCLSLSALSASCAPRASNATLRIACLLGCARCVARPGVRLVARLCRAARRASEGRGREDARQRRRRLRRAVEPLCMPTA